MGGCPAGARRPGGGPGVPRLGSFPPTPSLPARPAFLRPPRPPRAPSPCSPRASALRGPPLSAPAPPSSSRGPHAVAMAPPGGSCPGAPGTEQRPPEAQAPRPLGAREQSAPSPISGLCCEPFRHPRAGEAEDHRELLVPNLCGLDPWGRGDRSLPRPPRSLSILPVPTLIPDMSLRPGTARWPHLTGLSPFVGGPPSNV